MVISSWAPRRLSRRLSPSQIYMLDKYGSVCFIMFANIVYRDPADRLAVAPALSFSLFAVLFKNSALAITRHWPMKSVERDEQCVFAPNEVAGQRRSWSEC